MSELASSPPQLAKVCLLLYDALDSYSSDGSTAVTFSSVSLVPSSNSNTNSHNFNNTSDAATSERSGPTYRGGLTDAPLSQETYFSVTIPLVYCGYYKEVFRTSLQQRQAQEEQCRLAAREVEIALREFETLENRHTHENEQDSVFNTTEPHHNQSQNQKEALAEAVEASRLLWMEKVKCLDKKEKQLQQVTKALQTDVPRVRQQQRYNVLMTMRRFAELRLEAVSRSHRHWNDVRRSLDTLHTSSNK
jgi:leucyl aminopeptidase